MDLQTALLHCLRHLYRALFVGKERVADRVGGALYYPTHHSSRFGIRHSAPLDARGRKRGCAMGKGVVHAQKPKNVFEKLDNRKLM